MKAQLQQQGISSSSRPDVGARQSSTGATSGADRYGGLGLPDDPGMEVQEAVEEINILVVVWRRRGSKITVPTGEELRKMVEDKVGKKVA